MRFCTVDTSPIPNILKDKSGVTVKTKMQESVMERGMKYEGLICVMWNAMTYKIALESPCFSNLHLFVYVSLRS